ncbi:MAG TPA: response regulator transcription factor [Rugosimonospora sp.]|nr:response regulator transcription factor [Rugosimonospora sp.]
MLRVAIVDDHPVARYGMLKFLEDEPDIAVTAVAAAPDALPRVGGTLDADLLVLDLYLTGDEPAVKEIAELAAQTSVLVMSASRNPIDVLAAVRMGAGGYITKDATKEAFLAAVRAVAAGEFHLSPQLADLIGAAVGGPVQPPGQPVLSPREQLTLNLIARGFTHQQAATRMGISKATVDTYVARIRTKLQVGNKAELALAAMHYMQWRGSTPPA